MTDSGRLGLGLLSVLGAAWLLAAPRPAQALIPECGGRYIDAHAGCELRVDADCQTACDLAGMLDACAADLAATCSGSCNVEADTTCTGDCGASCESRCRVEDVVCAHSCVEECEIGCPEQCDGEDDTCLASCEATCAQECDTTCETLPVDAQCYEHCNRCCVGMCRAQINLDCQIACQRPDFRGCQSALQDNCQASCSGEGALFCDGQFVVAGDHLRDCLDALLDREIEVEGEASASASLKASGCSVEGRPRGGASAMGIVGMLVWLRRRRPR